MNNEPNMIADLRAAKAWVDAQSETIEEMGDRLRRIEQDYLERKGDFAALPIERPEAVREAIRKAAVEPGRELLLEA